MDTTIIKITKRDNIDGSTFLTIYFKYFDNERFTYFNQKTLNYWKNKGIDNIFIGQKISVMSINKGNNYHIFNIEK